MAKTMSLTKQVLANIYRQLRNFIANLIFLANTLNPSLKVLPRKSFAFVVFCLCCSFTGITERKLSTPFNGDVRQLNMGN